MQRLEDALYGEIWVDINLANSIGGEATEIVDKLQNGIPMDVSTGYLAEVAIGAGYFHGEEYQGEQTYIIPDHLAVLPNIKGACSWGDGCGTPRVNDSVIDKKSIQKGGNKSVTIREVFRMLGDKLGFSVETKRSKNEMQFICQHCSEQHTLIFSVYKGSEEFDLVAECPETQNIICVNQSIRVNGVQLGKMLDNMVKDQKSDSVNRAGLISQMALFAGTTVDKVKQVLSGEVTFVPQRWLSGFAQALDVDLWDLYDAYAEDTADYRDENFEHSSAFTFFSKEDISLKKTTECGCGADEANENSANVINEGSNNEKEVVDMTCPKVVEAVANLIENENTRFVETDREFLESLELSKLELFVPIEVSTEETTETANTETVVKSETESNEEETAPKEKPEETETKVSGHTIDDLLSGISNAEHKETLIEAYRFSNETRNNFVTKIIANSEFSVDELKGKQLTELRKINSLIEAKVSDTNATASTEDTNFGLANGSRTNVGDDLIIPVVPYLLAKSQ